MRKKLPFNRSYIVSLSALLSINEDLKKKQELLKTIPGIAEVVRFTFFWQQKVLRNLKTGENLPAIVALHLSNTALEAVSEEETGLILWQTKR